MPSLHGTCQQASKSAHSNQFQETLLAQLKPFHAPNPARPALEKFACSEHAAPAKRSERSMNSESRTFSLLRDPTSWVQPSSLTSRDRPAARASDVRSGKIRNVLVLLPSSQTCAEYAAASTTYSGFPSHEENSVP